MRRKSNGRSGYGTETTRTTDDVVPAALYTSALMAAIEPLPEEGVSLGAYIGILRHRKWSIVVVALLCVLLAALYIHETTPIYESSSRVNATTVLQLPGQTSGAPNMETEIAYVTSDSVTKCAQILMADPTFRNDPSTPVDLSTTCSDDALANVTLNRQLQQDVVVSQTPPSTVMGIAFDSPNPKAAQVGSMAFTLAYVNGRTTAAQAQLDLLRAPLVKKQQTLAGQVASYGDKITALNNEAAKIAADTSITPQTAQAEIAALQGKIQDWDSKRAAAQAELSGINDNLTALDPSRLTPPTLLLPAGLPQKPISPNVPLLLGVGLLAGLVLGIALAFLRERLDDSLRGRVDLEANLRAPVVAVIPKVPGWRSRQETKLISKEQPKSAVAEAYRALRTSIAFATAQRGLKVIMVTSPGAGEGKSTTAANLAAALADAGKRVILVSADLRKPRIHRFFGLENNVGLSNVLTGEIEPWEAIQDPAIEDLRVISSGPVPGRPAELLQSEAMGEVVSGLREVADYVVMDTAPILLVSDALALAPLVDGVLFVADSDKTTRSAVAHARDQLEQVGSTIIGSVLNNFHPSKAKSYRYYGYYGPYYYGSSGYSSYGYGGGYENGSGGRRPVLELPQEGHRP
jgi:capsular exopolysaccharide synthesis family protein